MNLKTFFILAGLLAGAGFSRAQDPAVVAAKTDPRVELLSIVFRLAGNPEYNKNPFPGYVKDIHEWFGPYKEHPAVKMASRLRMMRGVSYDAVMAMAIHISPPPALEPLIPFSSTIPESRWGRRGGLKFLRLLRDFYRETNFSEFYQNHQPMYSIAESRMDQLLTKVDFTWFEKFYGVKSNGTFHLLLGIGNGGGNYGPKVVYPDGTEDLYAIMGTWMIDPEGNPTYSGDVLETIIHEFNHSFANPLVNANIDLLQNPGETLFHSVREQMSSMAYGSWKTVMYESLVRASTIRYFIDGKQTDSQIRRMVVDEMSNGFLWMDQLVASLGDYAGNRSQYPSLSAFMPRIASLFAEMAPKIGQMKSDYEANCATVESISPFTNGATDVGPALKEIRICFSRPMNIKSGYSINYGNGGREHFAISGSPLFVEEGKCLTIPVTLKPDWEYSFILTSRAFRTMDEFPLMNYTVTFKTRPAN